MHIHKWSKWKANRNYEDISFGCPGVQCTELTRMCKKCRKIKVKDISALVTLDREYEW